MHVRRVALNIIFWSLNVWLDVTLILNISISKLQIDPQISFLLDILIFEYFFRYIFSMTKLVVCIYSSTVFQHVIDFLPKQEACQRLFSYV
jgi:hypothetical protein